MTAPKTAQPLSLRCLISSSMDERRGRRKEDEIADGFLSVWDTFRILEVGLVDVDVAVAVVIEEVMAEVDCGGGCMLNDVMKKKKNQTAAALNGEERGH